MREGETEGLKMAAVLTRRTEAACAFAGNATPGIDRLHWSNVGQDYAEMVGTLRGAVLIDNPDMVEIAA